MIFRTLLLLILALAFSGCHQMDPTEYGVRFRKLPPLLGGGVSKSVIRPGEIAITFPWDSIYAFDTKPKDVSWGAPDRNSTEIVPVDFVYTRAKDGNEVALAFTVRYRISPDPESLVKLVETTATSDEDVRVIVIALGRSDIRRFMNELHTSEFLDTTSRYAAVDKIKESMKKQLDPFGIEVVQVNLDDYRFERKLKDDTVDSSYQARLTEIQQLTEDTERERSRSETVKAQKEREKKGVEAFKAQLEAEAIGYKNQSKLRGDAYYDSKANEAKAILARGKAEAEGMIEKMNALSGAGGEALLKLEIAKTLKESNSSFVVMGERSGANAVDVQKIDTNQLIQQLGIIEGLKPAEDKNKFVQREVAASPTSSIVPPTRVPEDENR